ncbi:MAG: carboxypeptidase-like regulatory domain-containing protein [Muribaculaceae bacterium]|nr:carboxypeptidase-like regulatory domain-containing protein [Muribaculaceae bacterium]
MRYIFTYILLTVFILLPVISRAAGVTIHGRITDASDEPIEFVTVKVAGTSVSTTSSLEGTYRISCASADTLTVLFTCIGFNEERRTLFAPKGDITLNMQMRESTRVLDEVSVTEIRKQTGSLQKIDTKSLRNAPDATGGSIESMLATMGGVSSGNELSSQYSVRGGTYDENSVYINGIEVYRPLLVTNGQQEGLSIINPDMVGAVSFSTGGFTAAYADKMSSALDITYRQPEAFEGSVSASLMGASLSIGQSAGRFSQLHGVRYKKNNSLLSSLETKGEYDPSFFDYQTNMTLNLSSKFRVSFLGNVAVNNYKFTPTNRTTNFGTAEDAKQFTVYFDGMEKDRFETYFGALTLDWNAVPGTKLSFIGSGFLSNELVAYDISGEYWLDQAGTSGSGIGGELGVGRYQEHARNRLKSEVLSGQLRGTTKVRRNTFTYGIGVQSERIHDRSREWERRDSAGFSQPVNPDALKLIYSLSSNHDLSSTRMHGFIQDDIQFNGSAGLLVLNAGVRFSHWSFNKETLVSPRVNIGFVPSRNPNWALRFATGLYYQSPFYKEFRLALPDESGNMTVHLNSDIKSQRSLQFILGTDYTFRAMNRPFKLSGEVYYKALSDLIPYELDNLKVSYSGLNQSGGYAMGIDMKLFGQFVPGSDSWISLSLMKTREDINGVSVPRPTERRYNLAVYFNDYFTKIPRLKFSLKGILSDGLPMTAPHSTRDISYFRTPAYKRVDIGLSYSLLPELKEGESRSGMLRHIKSIWIGADVFNLFDISNVSNYYWVTDVNNIQYAVPNYLTRRQFNVRLNINF